VIPIRALASGKHNMWLFFLPVTRSFRSSGAQTTVTSTVASRMDSQPAEQPIGREVVALIAIGVALLAAVALRWFDLEHFSLWWDEGFTAWASSLSPARIIPFARGDNQAPLYYLVQHYWTAGFGSSEFALRALSALFGTLALPVFYLLSKKVLQDSMATALAMCIFAFSMKQIWYSREARVYETASFFALVAIYALMLFLEKRSAWAFLVIVLSSALTLYLHNMMLFYLLAFDVVWLVYPSDRTWARRMGEMLLANLCIGLLCLPWLSSLLAQAGAIGGNLFWVTRPTLKHLMMTLRDTAGFNVDYLAVFAGKFLPFSERASIDTVAAGVIVLCGAVLAFSLWHVPRIDRRKSLCFLLYCVLPIFLVFLLGQRMPLYLDRVFTTSSVVVPLLFAFPLAVQKRPGAAAYGILGILLAGTLALSAFGFIRYGEEAVRNGEDWRGVTATLLTIPETNRLIVFAPPAGEIFFDYYGNYLPTIHARVATTGLPAGFHDHFPPPKAKMIGPDDIQRLKQVIQAGKYSEIDLVLAHEVDPHGLIVDYLNKDFLRREEPKPSGSQIRIIPFRAVSRPEPSAQNQHGGDARGLEESKLLFSSCHETESSVLLRSLNRPCG